jgi:hypothetical protein
MKNLPTFAAATTYQKQGRIPVGCTTTQAEILTKGHSSFIRNQKSVRANYLTIREFALCNRISSNCRQR